MLALDQALQEKHGSDFFLLLLTRPETLSQRKKKNESPCAYLFILPNRIEEIAGFRSPWYVPHIPSSRWEPPLGHHCRSIAPPAEVPFPLTEESDTGDHRNTIRPLILFVAQWSVSPTAPASHRAIMLYSVVPRMRPRAGLGTCGVGSVRGSPLHMTSPTEDHSNTPA